MDDEGGMILIIMLACAATMYTHCNAMMQMQEDLHRIAKSARKIEETLRASKRKD